MLYDSIIFTVLRYHVLVSVTATYGSFVHIYVRTVCMHFRVNIKVCNDGT